ncbi:CDP-alcohol phosphatidyltransferase family protein [Shouchella clausii]|uniref:CDP-alcohol phosphatidyltransferase family protein n=1 Tax=Shouchella clausii TaxID=79880 RepID=A0A268RYW4_SHOCL|nr:CDP-alcohol phosphatidyltransferase family protein [Shouchella clausii]PAD43150.1 hypothetical protein CHH54_08405 [Bacillus sp. 7520-S]MBU8596694.1 CDP-alcohol phosphatidyltransferase family protein [Shouchella clausii]MCM3550327.1 CDP-alcohol phosphatidyltransferase family protein [Shouchella clausii]MCY1106038.1 CDP-alcohol phosphatidyltransferase family protein [Shouchella clausii]MEB5478611.1 CDP-alcohol phosphatidyltransferase family protein [Shouchella clausii]
METNKLPTTWLDTKAIRAYRQQAQSYSTKEDLWSWYVLRRLSIYVTIVFLKWKWTPNAVSWMSAFFVAFSGFWLLQATPAAFIVAFFCYNIGYLFDCVDGEMARISNNTSKKGYFIDLLIQGATLPVYLAMPLSLMVALEYVQLDSVGRGILYLLIVLIIMALFVPIAYQLTHSQAPNARDPVNKIRTKGLLFEAAGVLLGLPGFFFVLALITLVTGIQPTAAQSWYIGGFLLVFALKVCARFFLTVRSF